MVYHTCTFKFNQVTMKSVHKSLISPSKIQREFPCLMVHPVLFRIGLMVHPVLFRIGLMVHPVLFRIGLINAS